MDDVSGNAQSEESVKSKCNLGIIIDKTEIKDNFQSPCLRTHSSITCKTYKNTPSRSGYSESSDNDIPSYQINQSVNKRSSSKSENENPNDINCPSSPVFSPVVVSSHRFRIPSIHSLETITKRCNLKAIGRSSSKKKRNNFEVEKEPPCRTSNIYESLQMTDQDISWVSSMASPPAPIPNSEFNTIEKATFLPEENFQKIQPRALFSPNSDDNCGCSPLPMSSATEDEEDMGYRTKARLSDVCATLRELEFKSQDYELSFAGQKNDRLLENENDDSFPVSPVFVVKPKKSAILRKNVNLVRSPESTNEYSFNKCVTNNSLKEMKSSQCEQDSSAKESELFLDVSFSELDKMCNSLLQNKSTSILKDNKDDSMTNITLKKEPKDMKINLLDKSKSQIKRHYYPSHVSNEVKSTGQYFSSYDEIHNNKFKILPDLKPHIVSQSETLIDNNSKLDVKNISVESSKSENKIFLEKEKKLPGSKKKDKKVSLDVFDEEEIMLKAVEEAEKTLAEESQMMKAIDGIQNTLVPGMLNVLKSDDDHSRWNCNDLIPQLPSLEKDMKRPDKFGGDLFNSDICFSSASGSKLSVTKAALEKAKAFLDLIEEPDNESVEEADITPIAIPSRRSEMKSDVPDDSKAFPSISELNAVMNPVEKNRFDFGFSTASGSKVLVSKNALLKAKELFAKCDESESVLKEPENSFATHSMRTSTPLPCQNELEDFIKKKKINKISSNDVQLESNVADESQEMASIESTCSPNLCVPSTSRDASTDYGFSDLKTTMLEKSWPLEEDDVGMTNENIKGFASKSLKTSTPKEIFRRTKFDGGKRRKMSNLCFKELEKIREERDVSEDSISGLDEAVQGNVTPAKNEKLPLTFKTSLNYKFINCTEESVESERKKTQDLRTANCIPETSCFGFSTASGAKVSVSEKALLKAKEFMNRCDEDTLFHPDSVQSSTPKPFRKKLKEKPGVNNSHNRQQEETKVGFKCEKEMLETTINFDEKTVVNTSPDRNFSTKDTLKKEGFGFSTASGVKVAVSDDALRKAKLFMAKCERDENNSKPSETPEVFDSANIQLGFTTGLGKKIGVSNDALDKARLLMSSCEETSTTCSLGNLSNLANKTGGCGHLSSKPLDTCAECKPVLGKRKKRTFDMRMKEEENKSNVTLSENDNVKTQSLPSTGWEHQQERGEKEDVGTIPAEEWDQSFSLEINDKEIVKKRRLSSELEHSKGEEKQKVCTFSPPLGATGVKRTIEQVSVPSKRMKCVDDQENKILARQKQDKIIKEKGKVKPLRGTHMKKKITEKQTALVSVVGRSPSVNLWSGTPSAVDAVAYAFQGSLYMHETTTVLHLDDGFEIIPNDNNMLGVEEFKKAFLAGPGVQPDLVPQNWVQNHFKWIVWKLSHYEKAFPKYFKGVALTPNNVMLQLKYRYDREIDNSQRSALKKILEKDDTSTKRMVLRVCSIRKVACKEGTTYELDVTDGWYSCPAKIDPAMVRLIERGKITEGIKLVMQGAVLVNCDQGMPPLEISEDVHLRIFTNSTRKIYWNAKLGFQKNPGNIVVNLDSISAEGGPISRVDVIVVRVYPLLYSEKKTDGRRIVRNRRTEEKADSEYRKLLEQKIEKVYNEVRMEISSNEGVNIKESISQNSPLFKSSSGFSASEFHRQDELNREISAKVEERLKRENLMKRDVSELMKVKLVDLRKPNFADPTVLSIWSPGEDVTGLFVEGKSLSLMNLAVSTFIRAAGSRQINTTRQTRFKQLNCECSYPERRVTSLGKLSNGENPVFGEVDLVGIVVVVRDVTHLSTTSQIVYLADSDFNFAGLSFWGTCKDYGWEKVLVCRRVIACSNLCWRSEPARNQIPILQVKETSVFTENPKSSHLKDGMDEFKRNIPKNSDDFVLECEERLKEILEKSKRLPQVSEKNQPDMSGTEGEADCSAASSFDRQEEKVQKLCGKSSNSSFRWLPYKNVS